jgi:sporulation protein YlmC with PRC-barrel domain
MKATIVMTKDAIKKGEYKDTSLDVQKKQADILVVAIDDKYTLWLNRPITVKGRGIKKVNEKTIVVTDNAFDKLKTQYSIMFDL